MVRKKLKTEHKLYDEDLDITSTSKQFSLNFDNTGPYICDYFSSGRYLLLAGRRGHVAAFDWVTKDLMTEFDVKRTVRAVKWLHMPDMFTVAQQEYVYMYDKSGVELNVLKNMHKVTHLEFLRYHFLLASASEKDYLNWTDITIGKEVANFKSRVRISSLKKNPHNSLLFCSHPNGTISMWSPNSNRPALSMLCHKAAVRDVTVSMSGNYFATTGVDRSVKVWDLRNNYQCLKEHKLNRIPEHVEFSQRDILAVSTQKLVNIYTKVTLAGTEMTPHLKYNVGALVNNLQFCAYEDIIGVGHANGFTSLLVPGSGEPNFDSFEANPFMTKSQKKELEVKMLLDKLNPELICLSDGQLARQAPSTALPSAKR